MIEKELAAIAARAKAATEGPWHWREFEKSLRRAGYEDNEQTDLNASFIAHARTDIPRLLAYIEELEKKLRAADNAAWNACDYG